MTPDLFGPDPLADAAGTTSEPADAGRQSNTEAPATSSPGKGQGEGPSGPAPDAVPGRPPLTPALSPRGGRGGPSEDPSALDPLAPGPLATSAGEPPAPADAGRQPDTGAPSDAQPPPPVVLAHAGTQGDDRHSSPRSQGSRGAPGRDPERVGDLQRATLDSRVRGNDVGGGGAESDPSVLDPLADRPGARQTSTEAPTTSPLPEERGPDADGDRQSGGPVPPFEYWATPVEPGRTLIEASAGTGKTFAVAGLVLRLVLDGDVLAERPGGLPDLRRLLVVTFTVAATEELKTRIRDALRTALDVARGAEPDDLTRPLAPVLARSDAEPRLLAALDRVDEAGVFTIHGFCKRVLEASAFESATPFVLDFAEDVAPLAARAAADAWAGLVHAAPRLAALAVRLGWTPADLAAHHAERSRFPETEIVPPARPVADALAALDDAARQLDEAWDSDAVLALLDGLVWTSKAHVAEPEIPAAVRRVAGFLSDPDAVAAVRAFTPAALDEGLHGSRKVNKERGPLLDASPAFAACAAVDRAVTDLHLALVHAFSDDLARRVPALKDRRGVLGFDDLLTRLHGALHRPATADALAAAVQRQFAVAVVDEFQDTDPVQYEIFRRAFDGRPLFFVGDPKQAIYAFRGADIHAYLRAQREADRRYTLSTNWRSASALVAAVNAVFARPARPFLYADIAFAPVGSPAHKTRGALAGPPLVWWAVEPHPDSGKPLAKGAARDACLVAVVAEARRLLDEGTLDGRAIEPADLAVLVRSNTQAQQAQAALRAAGIPAVISRAGDIRDAQETADVEVVLRAAARPEDARALRAALATELWGWTAHEIAALDEDDGRLSGVQSTLRDLQKTWRRWGVLRALREFGEAVEAADGTRQSATERLLAAPDGARRATNLRHVVELLHEAEGAADRSPEDLLHWLRTRHDQTLASREKAELRLESDDRAVQITTVHNAKGLEYEVVFLPYLWDVHSKDYDADFTGERAPLVHLPDGRVVYDLGSESHAEHRAIREAERLAEFLRLAYVALTRARERAYVAWGAANEADLSALGLLVAAHDADGETDAELTAAVRRAARKADPLAALAALARAHPESMEVRPLPDRVPSASRASTQAPASERGTGARALADAGRQRAADTWGRASFSAWTSGRHAALSAADEPDDDAPREPDEPAGVHAWAAGRTPGTALHTIIEHADWPAEPDDATLERRRDLVARTLARYALDKPRHHRALIDPAAEAVALLGRLDRAALLGGGRLSDADLAADEWAFAFPLARVAPRDLADALRQSGDEPFGAGYADAVAALGKDAADGFMTGSADLVARRDGRWWVVDWKSNRLGSDAGAYGADALAETMRERHYGLQLVLYTLGLHRYLRTRIDGYDYDAHVGGATYVFLRGLADDDPAAGLFTHRPPRALVDALDALLSPDA